MKTRMLTAVLATGLAAPSFAAVLAEYTFETGTSLADSGATSDTDVNSVASAISFPVSGLLRDADSNIGDDGSQRIFYRNSPSTGNFGTWLSTRGAVWQIGNDAANSGGLPSELDDAIAENDYIGFTIDPVAGFDLTFESVTFDGFRNNGSSNANMEVYLLSSIDGFTSSALIGFGDIATSAAAGEDVEILFSGAQFENVSTATEFRFYFADDGAGGTSRVSFDNFVLNGTSQLIPEPASLVLAGLGLSLLAGRRRRA